MKPSNMIDWSLFVDAFMILQDVKGNSVTAVDNAKEEKAVTDAKYKTSWQASVSASFWTTYLPVFGGGMSVSSSGFGKYIKAHKQWENEELRGVKWTIKEKMAWINEALKSKVLASLGFDHELLGLAKLMLMMTVTWLAN
jgi:hypothetical protein